VLGLTGRETGTFAVLSKEATPKSKGSQGDKNVPEAETAFIGQNVPWSCKSMCRELFERIEKAGVETLGWAVLAYSDRTGKIYPVKKIPLSIEMRGSFLFACLRRLTDIRCGCPRGISMPLHGSRS